MVPSTEFCSLCHVAKDHFWEMADKLPMGASIPLESTDEEAPSIFDSVRRSPEGGRDPDKSLIHLEDKN